MGDTVAAIGVLALQGDVAEHVTMLESLGARAVQVKQPRHLDGLDGLIIPGGESTTIGKLLVAYDLCEPIRKLAVEGFPIWGTCAGMILLARDIAQDSALPGQPLIGVMPIRVRRNGFGRQVDSFEVDLNVKALGDTPFRGVFICAPYIEAVYDGVHVLASLPDGTCPTGHSTIFPAEHGRAVAARQGSLLVTSFHPELTNDTRFHRYFLDNLVRGS